MTDDLSAAIERLRTSTQRLNQICDEAAETVRDVERFLEEAQVGIAASISLGYGAYSEEADSPDWEDMLWYSRVDTGKFRIAVVRREVEPPHEIAIRPWAECTRDEKLASFQKLPDLLLELARRAEERTAKAEQTIASLHPLLQLPKKRKGG